MEWRWSVVMLLLFHHLRFELLQIRSPLHCIRMHITCQEQPFVASYFELKEEISVLNIIFFDEHTNLDFKKKFYSHPRVRVSKAFGTQLTTEIHWPVFTDHIRMWSSRYKPYKWITSSTVPNTIDVAYWLSGFFDLRMREKKKNYIWIIELGLKYELKLYRNAPVRLVKIRGTV